MTFDMTKHGYTLAIDPLINYGDQLQSLLNRASNAFLSAGAGRKFYAADYLFILNPLDYTVVSSITIDHDDRFICVEADVWSEGTSDSPIYCFNGTVLTDNAAMPVGEVRLICIKEIHIAYQASIVDAKDERTITDKNKIIRIK